MPMGYQGIRGHKKACEDSTPPPNSLILQTTQVLQARLGGLLGRELTHIVFSRKALTNLESNMKYFNAHVNWDVTG